MNRFLVGTVLSMTLIIVGVVVNPITADAAARQEWENTSMQPYSKSLKVKFCSVKDKKTGKVKIKKPKTKTLKPGKETKRNVCSFKVKPYHSYTAVRAAGGLEDYVYCPKKKNAKAKWREVKRHTRYNNQEQWAVVTVKYQPGRCA